MTTHKTDTAIYALGHVEAQVEYDVNAYVKAGQEVYAKQLEEMWAVVNTTMQELIKENEKLQNQLTLIRQALA